jgi:predicted lactoylglutathione lyase
MSTTQDATHAMSQDSSPDAVAPGPVPTITNAGTTPATRHKLFVNIPVGDLQRSIQFFEALGFRFNRQFTDASATCMLVGEDAYFMLLAQDRFAGFSGKPAADSRTQTAAMFALSVESRAAVDDMVAKAVAAGGSHAVPPQDHGFMYGSSFYDLDGHHWEVFWMDPAAVNG